MPNTVGENKDRIRGLQESRARVIVVIPATRSEAEIRRLLDNYASGPNGYIVYGFTILQNRVRDTGEMLVEIDVGYVCEAGFAGIEQLGTGMAANALGVPKSAAFHASRSVMRRDIDEPFTAQINALLAARRRFARGLHASWGMS